jgi:hypothetical protein
MPPLTGLFLIWRASRPRWSIPSCVTSWHVGKLRRSLLTPTKSKSPTIKHFGGPKDGIYGTHQNLESYWYSGELPRTSLIGLHHYVRFGTGGGQSFTPQVFPQQSDFIYISTKFASCQERSFLAWRILFSTCGV